MFSEIKFVVKIINKNLYEILKTIFQTIDSKITWDSNCLKILKKVMHYSVVVYKKML